MSFLRKIARGLQVFFTAPIWPHTWLIYGALMLDNKVRRLDDFHKHAQGRLGTLLHNGPKAYFNMISDFIKDGPVLTFIDDDDEISYDNDNSVEEEQPEIEEEQPKIEQEQPKIEQEQPKIEQPKVEQEQPKIKQEQPKIEQEQPKIEQDKPKIKQEQPREKADPTENRENMIVEFKKDARTQKLENAREVLGLVKDANEQGLHLLNEAMTQQTHPNEAEKVADYVLALAGNKDATGLKQLTDAFGTKLSTVNTVYERLKVAHIDGSPFNKAHKLLNPQTAQRTGNANEITQAGIALNSHN